jgi:hypothetical protein
MTSPTIDTSSTFRLRYFSSYSSTGSAKATGLTKSPASLFIIGQQKQCALFLRWEYSTLLGVSTDLGFGMEYRKMAFPLDNSFSCIK